MGDTNVVGVAVGMFGITAGLGISRSLESSRGGERYFDIKTVGRGGYGSPFMSGNTRRNDVGLTLYSREDRNKLFGRSE